MRACCRRFLFGQSESYKCRFSNENLGQTAPNPSPHLLIDSNGGRGIRTIKTERPPPSDQIWLKTRGGSFRTGRSARDQHFGSYVIKPFQNGEVSIFRTGRSVFPLQNRYLEGQKCQNFPPAAGYQRSIRFFLKFALIQGKSPWEMTM